MHNCKFSIILLIILMIFISCDNFVKGVDPLIDRVEDEKLNDEKQIPFVIKGVKAQFSFLHSYLMLYSDLLSDEMFFDFNLPGASYSKYYYINRGYISFRYDNGFSDTGELRFLADDIVRRVGIVQFNNNDLKLEALFWGNFFGGVARYYYATYYGLTEEQGGGCIDAGPFIPSEEMYKLSIEKFETALEYTDDSYLIRLVNSLIARIYIFQKKYTNAQSYAQNGLKENDEPFQVKYLEEWPGGNEFAYYAHKDRPQAVIDWRFKDYVDTNSTELQRVPIDSIMGNNDKMYYLQNKYPYVESPMNFITWQENELMLAEIDLQAGAEVSALDRVNKVRASHGVSILENIDMEGLIIERDKELFVTGLRLVDQRRFDAEYNTWHLEPGRWRYLPIPQSERDRNPNLN